MTRRPPAAVGATLADIDTPALIIDLDAFERNLDAMATFGERNNVRIRPHAKTHKSPDIARLQIARGAVGQCCQKVSEAETLVDGGVLDVLVSNEVIGAAKLDRLAALANRATISICVDSSLGVAQLAQAAQRHNATINVLVEIDVGQKRCGIAPGEAAAQLANHVASMSGLNFAGLQAYHGGAQHMRTLAERAAAINGVAAAVALTRTALAKRGLKADIVGGAGSGTFELDAATGAVNELQPGSYIFMDADYARNSGADGKPFATFEHALFVLATVMSRPVGDRAVVDAGHKALPVDSGMPIVRSIPGAMYHRPSDEHGVLDLAATPDSLRPNLGQKIMLIPGHCDPTVNQHDWYVGVRGLAGASPIVETLWPIAARGALF